MKKTLNKIILFFLVILSALPASAQYYFPKEKAKYWLYRERLKNFMINGPASSTGYNIMGSKRENEGSDAWAPDRIAWGDTPWFVGYWMGTLATEYYLLTQAGYSSTSPEIMRTKEDLYGAIQAVNRLDWEAEQSWGCSQCGSGYIPCPGNLNGFLIADDIPNNFTQIQSLIDKLNGGLVPPADNYRAKCIASAFTDYNTPGREASMDHLIGLFQGLALVKRFLPVSETWNNTTFVDEKGNITSFVKEVQLISQRIVNYMYGKKWVYWNPCVDRCVIGVHNVINTNACDHPDPEKPCANAVDCCQKGGGIAGPEAIGFAAANKYIQDRKVDPMFISLVTKGQYVLSWNAAITNSEKKGANLPIVLAAIGNIWYITPNPFGGFNSSSSAKISDHLVSLGIKYNWEHFYLVHKLLYKGGSLQISDGHYQCLLNSAACRGYNGDALLDDGSTYVRSIEWGDIDRIAGHRNTYSSAFSGIDYMLYYNLYHINSPVNGYPYGPIPIKQLAPYVLLKMKYTEYDLKNFMGVYITAINAYKVATDPTEGKGRVTFAAGQSIQLYPGFEAQPGSFFNGYIDPAIGAMACNEPVSQLDCAGVSYGSGIIPNDTLPDADSVIVLASDTALGSGLKQGDMNTVFSEGDQPKNSDIQISIIPNPSMGVFTVACEDKLQKIEVVDLLGNTIYTRILNNIPVNMDIDISMHPPGIYFLKIQTESNIYTRKVIVE